METIFQLGSVIKLTVFFNLMPAITGLCSTVFSLEFPASDYSDGGIKKMYYTLYMLFLPP